MYTAVIFTSRRTGGDDDAYLATAARMEELAASRPGYLGIESVHSSTGDGITVSYWADDAAARAWKAEAEHLVAQQLGRERWYDRYHLRVATVEREYSFARAIYHAAMPDDWRAAQASGVYRMSTRGRTVEQEGFMHCSYAHQMRGVVARFYTDVDELVILHIDRARLEGSIRLEPPADGVEELFPHVYGNVPVDAVTATTPWRRSADGWGDPPVRVR